MWGRRSGHWQNCPTLYPDSQTKGLLLYASCILCTYLLIFSLPSFHFEINLSTSYILYYSYDTTKIWILLYVYLFSSFYISSENSLSHQSSQFLSKLVKTPFLSTNYETEKSSKIICKQNYL